MYFECKKCGKLVDDGSVVDKICAMCILYPVDAGIIISATEQKCKKKQIYEKESKCK